MGSKVRSKKVIRKIAEPLNDVQLVALIASKDLDRSPKEAVSWAIDLLAEAVAQCRDGELLKKVEEKLKDRLKKKSES